MLNTASTMVHKVVLCIPSTPPHWWLVELMCTIELLVVGPVMSSSSVVGVFGSVAWAV